MRHLRHTVLWSLLIQGKKSFMTIKYVSLFHSESCLPLPRCVYPWMRMRITLEMKWGSLPPTEIHAVFLSFSGSLEKKIKVYKVVLKDVYFIIEVKLKRVFNPNLGSRQQFCFSFEWETEPHWYVLYLAILFLCAVFYFTLLLQISWHFTSARKTKSPKVWVMQQSIILLYLWTHRPASQSWPGSDHPGLYCIIHTKPISCP